MGARRRAHLESLYAPFAHCTLSSPRARIWTMNEKLSARYSPRATEFVVFAIENVAKRLGRSGADVYRALVACDGINGFLYPSYDTLHTQGKDYIVDETIGWLRDRLPAFVGASA